jgi:hypothetical protein
VRCMWLFSLCSRLESGFDTLTLILTMARTLESGRIRILEQAQPNNLILSQLQRHSIKYMGHLSNMLMNMDT